MRVARHLSREGWQTIVLKKGSSCKILGGNINCGHRKTTVGQLFLREGVASSSEHKNVYTDAEGVHFS